MEVLLFGGLFLVVAGFVIMGLSLVFAVVTYGVALVIVVVQALWKAATR